MYNDSMEKFDVLLGKLDNLPDGYISRKTIKGKVYSYLQYFENGKIVSKYVPKDKLEALEAKLALRKQIENEIKELADTYDKIEEITIREKELTGNIMYGDKVAAKIFKGAVISIDESIAPLYLIRNKDAKAFFANRCVALTRSNARALLKALNINDIDDSIIPLYVNGCVITDNIWFKPSGSNSTYEDVKFGKNLYSNFALFGDKKKYPVGPSRTPEITVPGSFEKCWKFEDGSWYLYKKENKEEIFCDLVVHNIAEELGIKTISYDVIGDCVKSKNFTEEYNFDPIGGGIDEVDNLVAIYSELAKYGNEVQMDYIRIRYLDALTYNIDRTGNDMGLLRNKETGEVVSMAPNFDNNSTLTAVLPRLDIPADQDPVVKAFCDFINSDSAIKSNFKKCKLPPLRKDIIKKCIIKVDNNREDYKEIRNFIFDRFVYISKNI